MELSAQKIALLQKIVNAKLTKDELSQVTDKAKEILDKRPNMVVNQNCAVGKPNR